MKRQKKNEKLLVGGQQSDVNQTNNKETTKNEKNKSQIEIIFKSENKSPEKEKKTIFIEFHAFIAPEFKVDSENHSFGIICQFDWKRIRPLQIK